MGVRMSFWVKEWQLNTSTVCPQRRTAGADASPTMPYKYGRTKMSTIPRPADLTAGAKPPFSGGRQSWSMKFYSLNLVLVLITLRFDWRLRVQTG